MSSSGVRKRGNDSDRLRSGILNREKDIIDDMKVWDETTALSSLAGGGSPDRGEGSGSGNYMKKAEDVWTGQYGNASEPVTIEDNQINVSNQSGNSSPMLILTPEDNLADFLDTIIPGENILSFQEQLIQTSGIADVTIRPRLELTITNIVGTGSTVTVTVASTAALATGELLNILDTTNYDATSVSITVTTATTFTYSSTVSATAETDGVAQRGNFRTDNDEEFVSTPDTISHLTYDNNGEVWSIDYSTAAIASLAAKEQNLGDISVDKSVSFSLFDDRQLYGNLVGIDVTLSFSSVPTDLACNAKIYIPVVANVDRFVFGTTVIFDITDTTDPFSILPLADNDFLVIEFIYTTISTVEVISVKKNDETEGADVIPGIVGDLYSISNSASTVDTFWDQPETGTLEITYTISWSTSPAGNSTTGPTTVAGTTSGIEENNYQATGLTSATAYYFWVKGTNSVGDGLWAGPQQTNTEGISNAGDTAFAVDDDTFAQALVTWNAVSGALFTAFRTNSAGGDRVDYVDRTAGAGNITDTFNIEPSTEYKYTLQTYNEFNYQLATQTITTTSAPTPAPVFSLSATGQKLTITVTFVTGVLNALVEYSPQSDFSSGVVTQTATSTSPSFTTNALNASTTYYARALFVVNGVNGPVAATQNVTTSSLAIPDEPELDTFSIAGDNNGLLKIEIDFNNGSSVGEIGYITVRDENTIGDYTTYPGLALTRDNPPADDLDPNDENQVRVVRGGGGWGASGTITVVSGAVTAVNITSGGADYSSGEDIRIYDDDDSDYTGFRGTAIVSGGQLTGINISNGGDFYDNGNFVFFVGYVDDSIWTAGNQVTLRGVASNASGVSSADTSQDPTIGND